MRNAIVSLFALASVALCDEVTAYVSLDQEHSARVLKRFEEETGIRVDARYDTERSKTIGFVRRLISEKGEPQCDVFWNNELATTIKLKESGVLAVYRSPSAADIPDEFKDPDGTWTGFAARARVLIVNTDLVQPEDYPTSMWDLADPKWKGKTCMALPATGTTAAHAAVLFVRDEKKANEYFDALIANDVTWLSGNAHCMRDVSAGRFAFGWTDTDDFNVARIQGRPVARVFPDTGAGEAGVLYIPNSLVLIRNGPHPEAGRKLIDWLLRPAVEADLAASATVQIPVRPGVPVPDYVRRPDQIGKVMQVDWDRVGAEYDKWVDLVRAKFEKASGPAASGSLAWIVAGVALVAAAAVIILRRATSEPG